MQWDITNYKYISLNIYIYIYIIYNIYIYIYIYTSLRKQQNRSHQIMNLFPSCYAFFKFPGPKNTHLAPEDVLLKNLLLCIIITLSSLPGKFTYSLMNKFLSRWNYSQLRFNWTKEYYIYIYLYICVCVSVCVCVRVCVFFANTYLIKQCWKNLSTYFCIYSFNLPYRCYDIQLYLINKPSLIILQKRYTLSMNISTL